METGFRLQELELELFLLQLEQFFLFLEETLAHLRLAQIARRNHHLGNRRNGRYIGLGCGHRIRRFGRLLAGLIQHNNRYSIGTKDFQAKKQQIACLPSY